MILFLDTSALVKLYVEEPHSVAVREWVDEAEVVAACRVAYPEAVSALNRRMRAGDLSKSGYGVAFRAFRRDWDRSRSSISGRSRRDDSRRSTAFGDSTRSTFPRR